MSASQTTKLHLAHLSGGRCAMPDCNKQLLERGKLSKDANIGQAAHIFGENAGKDGKQSSARYNPNMTIEQRDSLSNLMFLCGNCHSKIDRQEEDYPADKLISIKIAHESWVKDALDKDIQSFDFSELEEVVSALTLNNEIHKIGQDANDYSIIRVDDKIQLNDLTKQIRGLLTSGLARASELDEYMAQQNRIDADFHKRFALQFELKYLKFSRDCSPDETFYKLIRWAQNGTIDIPRQAVCITIISYLFQKCDIFKHDIT